MCTASTILVGTTETRREEVTWPRTRRELAAGPEVEVSSHTPRFSNLTKAGWALGWYYPGRVQKEQSADHITLQALSPGAPF